MDTIVAEIAYGVLIIGAVLVGLYMSNLMHDLGVPHHTSRKIAHATGGLAFLLAGLLLSSGWGPLIAAMVFTTVLWGARFVRPAAFRGVGGLGTMEAMAEVWFPLASIPVIGVGWCWLDKPLTAIPCLLFMAWGDMLAGIVRSRIYSRPVKGLWGSLAMLLACLVIAWVFI